MTKPESYPFLRIAREHNIEYGKVLTVAKMVRDIDFERQMVDITPCDRQLLEDVVAATIVQQDVRAEKIDWLTGEPIIKS